MEVGGNISNPVGAGRDRLAWHKGWVYLGPFGYVYPDPMMGIGQVGRRAGVHVCRQGAHNLKEKEMKQSLTVMVWC